MSNVKVRYIGNKTIKRDTITNTLVTWPGQNSVAEVPEELAAQLCQHPNVWQLADKPLLERPVVEKQEPAKAPDPAPELKEIKHAPENNEPDTESDDAAPVTVEEVEAIIVTLDKETDFTDAGRPIVGKIRERFEGREVTTQVVKAAWTNFTAE